MRYYLLPILRAGLLGWAVLTVAVLALTGSPWVATVAAQTVPTVTPIPPATEAPPAPPSSNPTSPELEVTLQAPLASATVTSPELPGPGSAVSPTAAVHIPTLDVSGPITAGIGSVTFLEPRRGAQVTVVSGKVVVAPANWQRLTEGLRVGPPISAKSYFPRGYTVCLWLPAGAAGFKEVRVGYFDPSLRIKRWVMLPTAVNRDRACTARFRLSATFALFVR